MKKLLIVESPAKIKTIKKFLGNEFIIMSTMGHIMDLPPKRLGVKINGEIEIDYEPIKDKDRTIADLKRAAKQANQVYLAPDPDREGEIIAWHALKVIEKSVKDKNNIHRISFNEITKTAVLEALEHITDVDMQKVAAQQARRVLDRWVGYEVSPILWKKIARGLSAGRVQSVALRIVCERESAIRVFKPTEYWSVTGLFGYNKAAFEAPLTHIGKKKAEVNNKKEADTIVKDLKKESFVVESVTDKKRLKNPLPPFMTSTLQQAAYNRLGFSVKKAMTIAQKLYEGMPLQDKNTPVALITYMRTDSLRLSDTAINQARKYIPHTYGKEYLPPKAKVYAKKTKAKAQDAHEAIRPIDVSITPAMAAKHLSKDAARLYSLIWQRFVASQMKSAEYAQRQVTIKGGKYTFKVTGSTLLFDGFLKVYGIEEKEQKVTLPDGLKAKDVVDLKKIVPKQHFTQPPPRYSEASLVKELEKEGIGRPSTYSAILNTIQARKYVTLDKKRFIPTELGMTVTDMLVKNLPDIMDVKFTATMEEDLDKIASGDMQRDKLLRSFYKTFQQDLKQFKGKKTKKEPQKTDIKCTTCKKDILLIRFGKSGEFLGCAGYPECAFTTNFSRDDEGNIVITKAEPPALREEKCPQCDKQLRDVKGRFGPFIACSGYPECKYIHQIKAGFKCPQDTGDIVRRSWRGGIFWGCANYPKCKFAIFGDIEETSCPKCKAVYMLKKTTKKGESLMCADKECGYKN